MTNIRLIYMGELILSFSTHHIPTLFLNSIQDVEEDMISSEGPEEILPERIPVRIANLELLQDEGIKSTIERGDILRRSVRYSLTCRDVGRVANLRR